MSAPVNAPTNNPCQRLKPDNADVPKYGEIALNSIGRDLLLCASLYIIHDARDGEKASVAGIAYAARLAMIAGDVYAREAGIYEKKGETTFVILAWSHAVDAYGLAESLGSPGAERLLGDALKHIPG